MKVLDLFAGTGSSTEAFHYRGHEVYRVELDPQHDAELHADVTTLHADDIIKLCGGRPDFIWASPPCTSFSVASIGRHWESGGVSPVPKSAAAVEGQRIVKYTLDLIAHLSPAFWLLENPRGMLRKLAIMGPHLRRTVTYCQYGDTRMKPTDLWGVMPPEWTPRAACKNGAGCHVAAPRGSTTGTQGIKGTVDRSRVPLDLSYEICFAVESRLGAMPPHTQVGYEEGDA